MWLMNMEEHEPPPETVPTNAGGFWLPRDKV